MLRTVTAVISLTLFMAFPVSAADTQPESSRVITVGFFPEDYPPLFWHEGHRGIVQKVLDIISERSDFVFQSKLYPFNRLVNNVGNGSLDLEAWTSASWRENVADRVYFTEPFAEHCEVLVYPKDTPEAEMASSVDELKGKRIGVVQDYVFDSFEKSFLLKTITRIDSSNEERVLNMLNHHRSDAALMDEMVAGYLLKSTYPNTFVIGAKFDCTPVTFMFSKKKQKEGEEISRILQELKNEGIIEKILEEYR